VSSPEYRYSINGEDYNFDDIGEAVSDLLAGDEEGVFQVGDTVTIHRGTVVPRKASCYFSDAAGELLEFAQCRAEDIAGEWAEHFTYCTPDARESLQKLIEEWADNNLTCDFYGVNDLTEIKYVISEDYF
jgi:hypothetical protein